MVISIISLIALVISSLMSLNSIQSNYNGIVTRFGKVVDVTNPGLNFVFWPLNKMYNMKSGFDTDFKENIVCITRDAVLITIPRIYVDNKIKCDNLNITARFNCFATLYTNYFITDSKFNAKNTQNNVIVPEDGLIFKFIPEVLTEICPKITSYETQTPKWIELNKLVVDGLRKRVPIGQEIIAVRMERPTMSNIEWRRSITGIIMSKIYMIQREFIK